MQNEIKMAIAKKMIISNRNITIKDIIEQLEKQGMVNSGDSNSETGQVKTQPDGYIFEITEKINGDWEVTYIGNGEITLPEIVISLKPNTTGLTNEVIITMTAKAESGITSYTLPMGIEQSVASGTKEITKTYTATENGTYVFTVKNGNGKTASKSITIENILQNTIQMSASTTEYTYSNVVVTITWPERSSGAVKQIKIGESAWQTVTGSTTQITVNQNTTIKAKVQNSITDIMSNTLTIDNILQSGIIPISTKEQLLKIGTGEVLEIDGKLYAFGTSNTYELKNDFEFTGDYRETASRIQENNINIKGNNYEIIVTTAEGTEEYYTEYSKYYIATNKYGYVLDGLQAYYDGIDNTGTGTHDRTTTIWKDLSGNGNDGTLENFGMNAISGWGNNYLSLDGINDWVNCGEINSEYVTLEAMCLLKSNYSGVREIIGNWQNGGNGIAVNNDYLETDFYGNGEYVRLQSNAPLEKHLALTTTLTYDGNAEKNYINGILENSLEYSGKIASPEINTVMVIGANPRSNTLPNGWYGDLDVYGVRIYNRGLTAKEVEINAKADERRFKQTDIIPVYTEEQVLKMGSGENVYIEQENKTYAYVNGGIYEYKNNIEMTSDYTEIANKIYTGEIFVKLNENQVKSGANYYTNNSKYSIAVNEYGYVKENLKLLLDGIDNTGSGHSNTTTTWKDLSGNNKNGTLNNMTASSAWTSEGLVFDGEDDYVVIAEMNYSNITMEAVFERGVDTEEEQEIMNNINNGGYRIYLGSTNANDARSGKAMFGVYIEEQNAYKISTSSNTYTEKLEEGIRTSISGSYDGKRIRSRVRNRYSYLDLEGTIKSPTSNTQMGLGGNMAGAEAVDCFFKGTIYSARIYDRALSDEEQTVNYLADRDRFQL